MVFKRLDTVTTCLLACVAAAVALPAGEAALPTAAVASTGGQPAPADGGASTGTSASPNGNGGLVAPTGALVHQVTSLSGTLSGASANAPVAIERLDPTQGTWATIATAVTGANGSFSAHWRADHIGTFTLRAVPGGASTAQSGQPSQAPTTQLTIYRPSVASWFGPGFYGQRTACGETMSPTLLGVAHRSLPCGTLVNVSYGGHAITVPVVDRGPYRHGVSWDLTTATAQALGLDQTARIGALALRGQIASPNTTAGSSGGQPAAQAASSPR